MKTVNMILCIMGQMRARHMVKKAIMPSCSRTIMKGSISQADVDNNLDSDAVFWPERTRCEYYLNITLNRTDMILKTASAPLRLP